jgi:hypothetical protein
MNPDDTPRRPRRPDPDAKQLDPRALAETKRAAMLRRARRIRRSVAGTAAALFAALFLVVYVQLASGHDPALSAASKNTKTEQKAAGTTSSSTGGKATESSSSGSSEGSETESSETESAETESSGGPSAVTTSQS